MPFNFRRVPAMLAGAVLAFLMTACGEQSATGTASQLAPVTMRPSSGVPFACNSIDTCVGFVTDGGLVGETLKVCKMYPEGTLNPLPVTVEMNVVTTNVTPSPTSLAFLVQPNTCMRLWSNNASGAPDQVTVTELTPPGYTVEHQVSTIIRIGPKLTPDVLTPTVYPAAPGNSVTVTIGGPGIPGATVTFINTPYSGGISDFVWEDQNGNGIQDPSEPGIPGVQVTLNGTTSTTTGTNGEYSFTSLAPGTYTVTVATPSGYAPTLALQGSSATDNNGSGTSVTVVNSVDTTVDFGFYKEGSIGDFVWNDLNANGVQDTGEPGIAGVTVTATSGTFTASAVTGPTGAYSIANLAPGTYTVTVATPLGDLVSPSNAGGDPANDSNGSGTTVAVAGDSNLTIDFGFYQLGSIGDYVWNDVDGNGIQDVEESGIAGVLVSLSNGATTTTTASGFYSFPNLVAGTYTVTFSLPLGFAASPSNVGSDPTVDSNGSSSTVTVAGSANTTVDFGIYQPFGTSSCGYTQGYWKNHEEKWPAPYSPNARWMTADHLTPTTWDGLMGMSVKNGNSYMQLAHQWIAATLNRTSGAPMSATVLDVLNLSQAWLLANTPASGPVPNIKNAQATAWAGVLDAYNNGKLGTLHCN